MGVLNGLKILDFSTLFPGPYATMMLADMGAEVLRVSSKSRPDLTLAAPPPIPGAPVNAVAATITRNKRSVSLNLKCPEAAGIVRRLVHTYDIVLDQFRPGVMDRLGVGYEALRRENPALIYCALTGYGQTGPMRDVPGHDINYLARSGISSYSGRKATGPALTGVQVADLAAGSMNTVIGILGAVICRARTGTGQFVDVSMLDGAMALTFGKGAAFLVDGVAPGPETERTNGSGIYDYYETKDGKYLSVGCLEPKFFREFCRLAGLPELAEGGCIPGDGGAAKARVAQRLKTKTQAEWVRVFSGADVCVEPVLDFREVYCQDGQIQARNMIVELEVPGAEGVKVKQVASPIKFSQTPNEYRHAGCPTGWHTREVLAELGLDSEEIRRLEGLGAFD